MPSRDEIDAARTPRGSWTKAQLAEWGVPWPPPKGWKAALEAGQPPPTEPSPGQVAARQRFVEHNQALRKSR